MTKTHTRATVARRARPFEVAERQGAAFERSYNQFAVINVFTGEVLNNASCSRTATDVSAFFTLIDLHVSRHLRVSVTPDAFSSRKIDPTATWLPRQRPSQWRLHFTPTSFYCLDLVEKPFSLLTEPFFPLRVLTSADNLATTVETCAHHLNDDPKALTSQKRANDPLSRVKPKCSTLPSLKSPPHH